MRLCADCKRTAVTELIKKLRADLLIGCHHVNDHANDGCLILNQMCYGEAVKSADILRSLGCDAMIYCSKDGKYIRIRKLVIDGAVTVYQPRITAQAKEYKYG